VCVCVCVCVCVALHHSCCSELTDVLNKDEQECVRDIQRNHNTNQYTHTFGSPACHPPMFESQNYSVKYTKLILITTD